MICNEGDNFPLPPGDYRLIIDRATVGTAKSSGNEVMITKFRVINGEHAGYTFSKSLPGWQVAKLAKALGFPKGDQGYYVDGPELTGREFTAAIVSREYDGKFYTDLGDTFSAHGSTRELPVPVVPPPRDPDEREDIPF